MSPKVIFIGTLGVIILILLSLAQEMNRRWQIQKEVQRLQGEVHVLERQVTQVRNLNQYFQTADFRERLAREKLNYRGVGEKVVLIPEPANTSQGTQEKAQPAPEEDVETPLKWWRLFFVDNRAAG